jgi:hypothetical protein
MRPGLRSAVERIFGKHREEIATEAEDAIIRLSALAAVGGLALEHAAAALLNRPVIERPVASERGQLRSPLDE